METHLESYGATGHVAVWKFIFISEELRTRNNRTTHKISKNLKIQQQKKRETKRDGVKNADRHSNNNRLLVARLLFLVHFSSVGSSSGGGGPGENGNEAQNHGAYRTDPFFFLNKSIIKGTS